MIMNKTIPTLLILVLFVVGCATAPNDVLQRVEKDLSGNCKELFLDPVSQEAANMSMSNRYFAVSRNSNNQIVACASAFEQLWTSPRQEMEARVLKKCNDYRLKNQASLGKTSKCEIYAVNNDFIEKEFKQTSVTSSSEEKRLSKQRLDAYVAQIKKEKLEKEKKEEIYFNQLIDRCISFGIEGKNNISNCAKREAAIDEKFAMKEKEISMKEEEIAILNSKRNTQISSSYTEKSPDLDNAIGEFISNLPNIYFEAKKQARREQQIRNEERKRANSELIRLRNESQIR